MGFSRTYERTDKEMKSVGLLFITEVFLTFMERMLCEETLNSRKRSTICQITGWSIFFVIINVLTYLPVKSVFFNIILSAVCFFILICFYYEDSAQRIILTVLFWNVAGILSEILIAAIAVICGIEYTDIVLGGKYVEISAVSARLVTFMLIKIMILLSKGYKKAEIKKIDWVEVFLIPCGSLFLLVSYMVNADWYMLVVVTIILLINICTYYLYGKVQNYVAQSMNNQFMDEQIKSYIQQYKELEKMWIELREFRHDQRQQYILEQAYLERGEYDKLRECYKTSIDILNADKMPVKTGNIIFDTIINYKIRNAEKEKIKFITELSIPTDLRVNEKDIYVIIGNLLDNAIEAVKNVDETGREIFLKIKYDYGCLFINVSNAYDKNKLKLKNGIYLTSKKEKDEHGIGLGIVRKTAERYKGRTEIITEDDKFSVRILLCDVENYAQKEWNKEMLPAGIEPAIDP